MVRQEKGRSKPLSLVVCATGAQYHPRDFPAIPITPKQVIEDALRSRDEGAVFHHIHGRQPLSGYQDADKSWYQRVRSQQLKRMPEQLISFPTSRKGLVEKQISAAQDAKAMTLGRPLTAQEMVETELIRAVAVEARPDTITSFTAPEIMITGRASRADVNAARATYKGEDALRWKDPRVMRLYYQRIRGLAAERGVGEEVEITTWGAFDVVEELALTPGLGMAGNVHFVLLFGFSGRLPINRRVFDQSLDRIDLFRQRTGRTVAVTAGAVIPPKDAAEGPTLRKAGQPLRAGQHDYREVLEWVLEDDRVDAFRVGLEDTPALYGQAQSNPALVRMAAEIVRNHGVELETDLQKVRSNFNLDR